MKFATISGSLYEVDLEGKKCRRLIGMANPLPRQGKDGEWKSYLKLVPDQPTVGLPVAFVWDPATHPTFAEIPEGHFHVPATTTSIVVEILTDEN